MMRKSDPVDLFMEGYNHRRLHMSLGVNGGDETPAHAFIRKMHLEAKPWLTSKQGRNIMSNKVGGNYFSYTTGTCQTETLFIQYLQESI